MRIDRINSVVKRYDRTLFAWRHPNTGVLAIMRKASYAEASDYGQTAIDVADLHPQLVISLTDNWTPSGKPVDMGIEPLMAQLRSMDSWSKADLYRHMVEKREREQGYRDQSRRNELRAMAYDVRRDFAKAANDINTSTLEKVDNRRRKDGSYK